MLACVIICSATAIFLHVTLSQKSRITTCDNAEGSYECILILGAGVRDGKPSKMLADRLDTGIALYEKKLAPKIIVSGDHGTENYDEVNVMKAYLVSHGIPSGSVFMDHAGFCTYDSIKRARSVFGACKLVVVTQEFHLARALYIADGCGIDAIGVIADIQDYNRTTYNEIREIPAKIKDFFMVLFSARPTCLGESIDLSSDASVTDG